MGGLSRELKQLTGGEFSNDDSSAEVALITAHSYRHLKTSPEQDHTDNLFEDATEGADETGSRTRRSSEKTPFQPDYFDKDFFDKLLTIYRLGPKATSEAGLKL